jgi:CRISPR-associated protein Cmr5
VTQRQTIDQCRAAAAFDLVNQWRRDLQVKHAELAAQIKDAPVRILQCGLGQTLAFLKSKSSPLPDALGKWINDRIPPKQGENTDLLLRIIQGNRFFLQRATAETMAYLEWLKRFAEALRLGGEITP